jgi:hypothetical protein
VELPDQFQDESMAAKCIQVLFPARPSTCQSGRNPGSIVRDLQQVLALGSGGPHRMQSLAERQSQLAPELRPVRPATGFVGHNSQRRQQWKFLDRRDTDPAKRDVILTRLRGTCRRHQETSRSDRRQELQPPFVPIVSKTKL